MKSRCDVIIPVKDAVWWVEWCLEELFRCTDPAVLEKVLVVNDRSSAESSVALRDICSRFPSVELLQNEGASGFAGACNFAAERSRASALLFLNTDCLLTPGAIEKLLFACEQDASIGLASPLSNNSPELTLPMAAGRSYLEMNELLERLSQGRDFTDVAFDACTVVGNCLLITRRCWEATGSFNQDWGLGYGEETDYQFRAMRLGFRGVALLNTYVFHFGSGSFRYQTGFEELQRRNKALFHSKWGPDFVPYFERCSRRDPIQTVTGRLNESKGEAIKADVLYVLEGISQTIGGVHVVVETCNYLIRHGINAKCAVVGKLDPSTLQQFNEPLFFGLLTFEDETRFLTDRTIDARMVVATLFSTAAPAYLFARMRGIPLVAFVQGYEFLFDNGRSRNRVEQSYWLPDRVVTTSSWLESGVRWRTPDKPVAVLPVGVEPYRFLPAGTKAVRGTVRVAVFLRREPDKGQAILLELLDLLLSHRDEVSVTVFADDQPIPRAWFQEKNTQLVRIPVDKGTIARFLRRCDLLVDASLHEGFGLIPLEAMACGAAVVASDSGGINQFLKDGQNGLLVKEVNKPERFLAEVVRLVRDRPLLASLRREALNTARRYSASTCYGRYVAYFERCLEDARKWEPEKPILHWAAGDRGLSEVRDLVPGSGQSHLLKPTRRRAALIIAGYVARAGTNAVLKLQIFSSKQQMVTLPRRRSADPVSQSLSGILWSAVRAVRGETDRRGGVPFSTSPEQGMAFQLKEGRNELLIELPPQATGEPVRLVFEGSGDSVVESLQIREVSSHGERRSLEERFEASETVVWTLGSGSVSGLLATGMDILPHPAGRFLSFGDGPSLLLPEVRWPPNGSIIGWIDFSVPENTTAQLFYMSGPLNDYAQEASIVQSVKRGRNIFIVNLMANLTGRLRFDPGKVPGDYEIHAIRLYARGPSAQAETSIARTA